MIDLLRTTDDFVLMNTLALALSDIGDERAVEPILERIKDPKTKGYNGTLVYSLESFDTSPYVDFILELVEEGDYEVRREAYSLLEGMIDKLSKEKKEECLKRIKTLLADVSDRLDGLKVTFNLFGEAYMPVNDNLITLEKDDEPGLMH